MYIHVCRAYSRKRYDVLVFCQKHSLVNLMQQTLSLGVSNRPLLIDVIHTEQYALLHEIIQEFQGRDKAVFIQKILTNMYETGVGKDTLISYACRAYMDSNSNMLPSLLSSDTLGCHLTIIKIEGVELKEVPLPIFSTKLTILDLSKNLLTTLPIVDALSQGLCKNLKELTLANNAFTILPPQLFHLPLLTKLDARNNHIQSIPREVWAAPCLEELFLSKNLIASLPCPDYICVRNGVHLTPTQQRQMSFSHSLYNFSSDSETVLSAREAFLTAPIARSDLLPSGGFRLKTLDLSNNQLSEIPPGLPCLTPQLQTLKLSGNRINHLGHPCNYPQLLEKLDVNKNACKSCIQWCAEPTNLVCAQSQLRQEHSLCFHTGHRILSNLKFLFLEDNDLMEVMLEEKIPRLVSQKSDSSEWGSEVGIDSAVTEKGGRKRARTGERERTASVSPAPPLLMFPKLESLRLSNNQLNKVPSGIHRQIEMRELKLDNNPGITQLPSNLHLLQELFFFSFNGISDPVISELRNCANTPEQLLYLKAREKE